MTTAAADRRRAVAVRAALPVALLLWLLSLRRVDLPRMGDLGLLQVLPVLFWVAVLLLTAGFAAALYVRRVGPGWLAAYVLGLVAMVHATPALLYPELRYAWAWKHLAVVDAMLRHGGPVPHAGTLDIYNQWPGFFVLNGLLLRATGLASALGYAAWAPPVVNALLLVPLLLLYRTVTRDRRLVWGGVWIFYSCSWVGQDYFAPQAFSFLLYVVLLALVFRELPKPPGAPGGADAYGSGGSSSVSGRGRTRGWTAVRLLPVLLVEAVIVCSHQLTPLMLVTVLAALSLPRANRRSAGPPLLCAVVLVLLWGATTARPYLSANLGSFGQALLSPDGNLVAGFAGLGTAAPGQVLVDWADRTLTAAVLLLALVCVLRRRWVRRTGLPLAALAPLPLLAANSYGGEMIFRVYLFSLPASAFLVAALVLHPGARSRPQAVGASRLRPGRVLPAALTALLLPALLCGLFFGYYGKELMNWFTPAEVDAARFVTGSAPPGALIVALTDNVPGIYADYEQHTLIRLDQEPTAVTSLLVRDPLAGLEAAVAGTTPGTPSYLVLTRAQAAECYLTGILPADTMARLQSAVERTPGFTAVRREPGAVVYRFLPTASGAPR